MWSVGSLTSQLNFNVVIHSNSTMKYSLPDPKKWVSLTQSTIGNVCFHEKFYFWPYRLVLSSVESKIREIKWSSW